MDRYLCPPWYNCRCLPGKPVSESTMVRHMRAANKLRKRIGRGSFKRGPKVSQETTQLFDFGSLDTLETHPSGDESGAQLRLNESDRATRNISFLAGKAISRGGKRRRVDGTQPGVSVDPHSTHGVDNASTVEHLNQQEISIPNSAENAPPGGTQQEGMHDTEAHPTFASVTCNQSALPGDRDTATVLTTFNQASAPPPPPLRVPIESDEHPLHSPNSDQTEIDFDEYIPSHAESIPEDEGHVSRIPGFLSWLHENRKWVDLFHRHGLTNAAMDDILENIGAPCRSWKTVMNNIRASTPVVTENFSVCPGHFCFAKLRGAYKTLQCPVCGKNKPSSTSVRPNQQVAYIPFVPRIKGMIEDQVLSGQLYSYLQDIDASSDDVLRDYFDSKSFEKLCELYGGRQNMKHDIFLAASTDGFQAFENSSSDVWPLVAVMFNLPPDTRFITKNVLPLMFIPNDVQPKDLQSFLLRFVDELLSTLENGGIEARLPDGQEIRFRVHLVWFTADLAGLVKIAGITGHGGRFPCRFCLLEGHYSHEFHHYYYPTKIIAQTPEGPDLNYYNLRNLKKRTAQHTENVFLRLDAAQSITEKKRIATETGVKERSVLLLLPNLSPFDCFPPDIMHLFYNVQIELLNHHLSGMDDGFALQQCDIPFLDTELVQFKDGISGQIGVKPRPLSAFKRWKAAEHKAFTLSYSLILFDGYLENECLDGLEHFVALVDICFRSHVTKTQAAEVRRLGMKFIQHFEAYYTKFHPSRVNYCKYVIHLLLHLGDALLEYGPLMSAGQYWVEKYIGWIGERCNAKTLPAKSMLRAAWFGEAKRLFFREPFRSNDLSYQEVIELGGYRFLGPSCQLKLPTAVLQVNIADLLAAYLVRKHEGLNPSTARAVARRVTRLKLWSRMEFICESDTQTARSAVPVAAEYVNTSNEVRQSCFIAVEMDDTETYADVYYGKLLHLMEVDVTDCDPDNEDAVRCKGHYNIAVIRWADGLVRGRQNQVFKIGSRDAVFGAATVEDVSIIRGLIGVVEHSVPARNTAEQNKGRRRKQVYFVDDFLRIDHLLSSTRQSDDGVNRRLRGVTR